MGGIDCEPEAGEPVCSQELGVAPGLGVDAGWRMEGGD